MKSVPSAPNADSFFDSKNMNTLAQTTEVAYFDNWAAHMRLEMNAMIDGLDGSDAISPSSSAPAYVGESPPNSQSAPPGPVRRQRLSTILPGEVGYVPEPTPPSFAAVAHRAGSALTEACTAQVYDPAFPELWENNTWTGNTGPTRVWTPEMEPRRPVSGAQENPYAWDPADT
jgi:hypothetical protein